MSVQSVQTKLEWRWFTWAQGLCWHCTAQCLVGFSPSGLLFVLGAVHTQNYCLRSGSYWEPPNDYKIKCSWSDTSTVKVLLPSVVALSWATSCIQDMFCQRFRVVTKNNKISPVSPPRSLILTLPSQSIWNITAGFLGQFASVFWLSGQHLDKCPANVMHFRT